MTHGQILDVAIKIHAWDKEPMEIVKRARDLLRSCEELASEGLRKLVPQLGHLENGDALTQDEIDQLLTAISQGDEDIKKPKPRKRRSGV